MSGINVLFNTTSLNQSGLLPIDFGSLSSELGEYGDLDLSIFPSEPLSDIQGHSGSSGFFDELKLVYHYTISCEVLPMEMALSGFYPTHHTPFNIATLGFDRFCPTEFELISFTGQTVSSDLDTLVLLEQDHFAGEIVTSDLNTLISLSQDQFTGQRIDTSLFTLISLSQDHTTGQTVSSALDTLVLLKQDYFVGERVDTDLNTVSSLLIPCFNGTVLSFEIIKQYIPPNPIDFVFFCPYNIQHNEQDFIFPEPGCSLFNIVSGETTEVNLKTFGLDTIEFDFYSGSQLLSDLSLSSCFSYEHTSGTLLEIDISQSVIFDLENISGSELTIELSKSEVFDLDQYDGSIFDLNLTVEYTQSLDFDSYSGQSANFDLITKTVSYGGSELEVININDSRRNVTVSIKHKGYEWKQVLLIESITFESIQVMSQLNKSIKMIPSITARLEKSCIKIITQIRNKV